MEGTMTTYSFSAVSCTIQHPLVGQKVINGSGIGSITVAYSDNNTESDLGADGSVMISKVLSHRGTISIELQQTSSVNKWLVNLANALDNADASQWANGTVRIAENFTDGITTNATKVAIVKRPDHKNEQNGGRVSWELFSPEIIES